MRRNIVHMGASSLSYEIREIVLVARQIKQMGQEITWENIGDPVQKGEVVPEWIRDIVRELVDDPQSWAYCDTAGVPETREFLAGNVNKRRGGVKITTDDILFFNGLGDAVAKVPGVKHGIVMAATLTCIQENTGLSVETMRRALPACNRACRLTFL